MNLSFFCRPALFDGAENNEVDDEDEEEVDEDLLLSASSSRGLWIFADDFLYFRGGVVSFLELLRGLQLLLFSGPVRFMGLVLERR